jgi:hypothetical protein
MEATSAELPPPPPAPHRCELCRPSPRPCQPHRPPPPRAMLKRTPLGGRPDKGTEEGALVFPAPSARFDSSQRFFREIPRRSCFYVVYVQLREKQLPELLLELYQTHPFLSFVLRRIGSNVHRPHLSSTHALPEDPEAEASNPHTLPESSGPNRGGGVGLNFQLVSPLLSGRLL